MTMRGVVSGVLALSLAVAATGCGKKNKSDGPPPEKGYLADTGFRPERHGFPFKNGGGQFPKTPPVLDTFGMVRLFGKQACVGGDTKKCKLTPPAAEWAHMVNRKMNIGRCEGMAVASLTMFQKTDDPGRWNAGATSAHQVPEKNVMPLLGYYWAWQMVDPVRRERIAEMQRTTPAKTLERLIESLKAKQLLTLAFFQAREGGHAVTPYAVEHKGNDVYWVHVYDNNFPDKDRWIVIDKKANTWRYDVAALNPAKPQRPWSGNATTKSIVVVPVASRMKNAECPFCTNSKQKVVFPSAASIVITDSEGRKLGTEGDKVYSDIPGAEVVDLMGFVESGGPPEPVYILPDGDDYDLDITSTGAKPDEGDDEAPSVAVISSGTAISVGQNQRGAGERDTLSIARDDGGIRFKTGSGRIPHLRMAIDDDKEGSVIGIRNIKADKGDEIDLDVDRKDGKVRIQGEGKKLDAYDLKVRRVRADADDDEVEAKGVKIRAGESHAVDVRRVKKGAKPGEGVGIQRGKSVAKPKKERRGVKPDRNDGSSDRSEAKDPKAKSAKDPNENKGPSKPKGGPSKPAPPNKGRGTLRK